jgi:hypothetical protein
VLIARTVGQTQQQNGGYEEDDDAEQLPVHEQLLRSGDLANWTTRTRLGEWDNLFKENAKSKDRMGFYWDVESSLRPDCFRNRSGEFLNVFFRRVERAHPAHHRFLFHPSIEKGMLPDLLDGMTRDLREDAVGFDLPNYLYFRKVSDFSLQQPCHAVGVFGISPPKIVAQ